jgi:RNA polymerase sigma-70 factor (ECF subfamily)
MASETDLGSLVAAAREGDPAARERLMAEHRPGILRYLQGMLQDPATAEDLCQEACRRGLARLDDLRDPDRFRSWLLSIAINLCRAHLKAAVQDGRTGAPVDTLPAQRHSVLSSIVRRESAAALAVAIDRLPILLREAFVLHMVEGLPYAEIAAATGSSIGALQVRTHRAKALLRRQLGDSHGSIWLRPDPAV